ncbi:MAG TPA: helix-turn-helix domain-containing protein [Candidatus Omnitrophota bacterium]|nr:helix-turn-helix domain-containing protein [Candidatus Omnitrophota bacterium]
MRKTKISDSEEEKIQTTASIDIGTTIRYLREENKLSGIALCRRAKGLNPKTLTALEKGRIKNPSIATLELLAKGFGVTVSGLFRQAELRQQEYFSLGSPKGYYKIDFSSQGIQLISFTPIAEDFFCGKMIVEGQRGFGEKLLGNIGTFFAMTLIGQLEGKVEGKSILLKEGDNLFVKGGMKFQMTNTLQRNATLLLVAVPSCFKGKTFLKNN